MYQSSSTEVAAISEPVRSVSTGAYEFALLPRMQYSVEYTSEKPIMGFAFEAQYGTHAISSDRPTDFLAKSNSYAYTPVGVDVRSQSECGGEYLVVKINHSEDEASEYQRNQINQHVTRIAHNIRKLMIGQSDQAVCLLNDYASSLEGLILSSLADAAEQCHALSRYMTRQRTNLIYAYIEENLDKKITLQNLAKEIGLSSAFFSRCFKASTGMTPYDYIVDRRLYRARSLLQKPLTLTEIAYACGFASSAHMATVFKQRLGVTPSGLRALK